MTREEVIAKYGRPPEEVLAEQALGAPNVKAGVGTLGDKPAILPTEVDAYPGMSKPEDENTYAALFPETVRPPKLEESHSKQKPYDIPYEERSPYARALGGVLTMTQGAFLAPDAAPRDFSADIDQLQRNAVSGVSQIPGFFTGTGGFIAGIPELAVAGARYVMNPDDPKIEEDMMQAFTVKGGPKMYEQHIQDKIVGWQQQVPDLSKEQLTKLAKDYQDTQAHFDFITSISSTGLGFTRKNQMLAQQMAGDPRRPDQLTSVDEFQQIGAGALVGLPAAAMRSFGARVAETAIGHVLEKAAVRGVVRTVEMMTPITLPLTPANVALNTAVGTGINEALRLARNDPNMFTGDPRNTLRVENVPDPVTGKEVAIDAAGPVARTSAAVALFGILARRAPPASSIIRNLEPPKGIIGAVGGPPMREQPKLAANQLNVPAEIGDRFANVGGERGAWLRPIRKELGEDVAREIDQAAGHNASYQRMQAQRTMWYDGKFPDGTDMPEPPVTFQRDHDRLSPKDQQLLNEGAYADASIRQRELQVDEAKADILDLKSKITAARTTHTETEFQKKLAKREDDLIRIQKDDPSTRSTQTEASTQLLKQRADALAARPDLVAMHKRATALPDAWLEWLRKNKEISQKEYLAFKNDWEGKYLPFYESEYAGMNRAQAMWAGGKKYVHQLLGDAEFKERAYAPVWASPNLSPNKVGPKVNQPMILPATLSMYMNRTLNNVLMNKYRRAMIEGMQRTTKRYSDILRPVEFNNKIKFSPEEWETLHNQGKFAGENFNRMVVTRDKDGMIEAFLVGNKIHYDALASSPHSMNGWMKIANTARWAWQQGTTGVLNPLFTPVVAWMDTIVGLATMRRGRRFNLWDAGMGLTYRPLATAINQMVGVTGRVAYNALSSNSFFSQTLKGVVGEQGLRTLANRIARHHAESWAGIMTQQGRFLSHNVHIDTYDAHSAYTAFVPFADMKGSGADIRVPLLAAKSLFHAYAGGLDNIANGPKQQMFVVNYKRLEKKYKGRANIPEKELAALAQDVASMAGDLSQKSGARWMRGITTVTPFGNTFLRGGAHIVGHARYAGKELLKGDGPGSVMPMARLLGYGVAPLVLSNVMMSYWSPEAHKYWWQTLTDWQRMATFVIPKNPQDVVDLALYWVGINKEAPEFTPDKVHLLTLTPEFVPYAQTVIAAARAAGAFGSDGIPATTTTDLLVALSNVIGTPMPAEIALVTRPFGVHVTPTNLAKGLPVWSMPGGYDRGPNADMISKGSEVSKSAVAYFEGILGAAGAISMVTYDAWLQAKNKERMTPYDAAGMALREFAFEQEKRIPQHIRIALDVAGIWEAPKKYYLHTPVHDLMKKAKPDLLAISTAYSESFPKTNRETKNTYLQSKGIETNSLITDKNLAHIAAVTHEFVTDKNSLYKLYGDEMKKAEHVIYNIDNNRVTRTPRERHRIKQESIRTFGENERKQRDALDAHMGHIYSAYGKQFEAVYQVPFSLRAVSNALGQNLYQGRPPPVR